MIATVPRALLQFVDDEMLRAPLLFDQLIEGTIAHAQNALPRLGPAQRSAVGALMETLQTQRHRLAEYFTRSLHKQVSDELGRPLSAPPPVHYRDDTPRAQTLSLVDEDTVALDVELAHAVETIKSVAEYELRELQTFTSALVGDMDVARDHNPFRAEAYAHALWDAAQALPLSRGHQVAFMRHACTPLAQLLRKSYAASSSRLESMGVEPAAYRTLILPAGSRRGRPGETTFAPDLYRMRETMSATAPVTMPPPAPSASPAKPSYAGPMATAPLANTLSYDGQKAPLPSQMPKTLPPLPSAAFAPSAGLSAAQTAPAREHWSDIARSAPNRIDRQAIELVSRLFEAMMADERVPDDVGLLIGRLQGPAMRLTLRDPGMLDQDKHPLWRLINRLCFEAEMAPDRQDPDRLLLLRMALETVDRLAAEPEQNAGLYRWALDRLESFLHKRLARRMSAASSQIGQLQKLEDKILGGSAMPSTLHGMLDVPQLETVPAELLDERSPAAPPASGAEEWLNSLDPGTWVRMFLQGKWVHASLLWPGERREVWLFGDGASDATWAVRRGALLTMQRERLAKTLKQRSIVGSAAARVQDQVEQAQGAAAA